VPDWTTWVIAVLGGLGLLWAALLAALWLARPDELRARETARLLPDVVRLVTRLARDREQPPGVRLRLWLLLGYLALPVDVVPDFVPVIGYADDAIVVALVLRSVVRRAGLETVRAHWPGTDRGFDAMCRVAGLPRYCPGMRVGLTGGVAAGKSTVSAMLSELGAAVVDADQLAREVVAPGTDGLAEVVDAFGTEVLAEDGGLDRAALGAIVFADPGRRRVLEQVIHPRVRARAAEIEAAAPPGTLVVHDIPLLVETGQADTFDAVIVVDVPVETQVERMMTERGMGREEAESRVAAQASREQRLAAATYVIENTGSLQELRARVTEVYAELSS
jgi:dephospho-CoA kinase